MPRGKPNAGRRAPKKPRNITLYGVGVDRLYVHPGTTLVLNFAKDLYKIDTGIFEAFNDVITRWRKNYLDPGLQSSMRSTMFVRSQKTQNILSTTIAKGTGNKSGGASWHFRVGSIDTEVNERLGTLERGRDQGGKPRSHGSKNSFYLVPLASWITKQGLGTGTGTSANVRKYANKEMIARDLGQYDGVITRGPRKGQRAPRSFMLKQWLKTSTGYAKLILLYNKGRRRRSPWTGRFASKHKQDTLGRKVTRGKLREIATAMYLAYPTVRAIFSKGNTVSKKVPKSAKIPLAAEFGLTETARAAPHWFSRGSALALTSLYEAINTIKPRFTLTGSVGEEWGKKKGDKGGMSIDQMSRRQEGQAARVVIDTAQAYDEETDSVDEKNVIKDFEDAFHAALERQNRNRQGLD